MSASQASALDPELGQLDDLGLLINDREAAERVFRLIGVLVTLHKAHSIDEKGRCRRCRPARWWRRRHACTVHDALTEFGIGRSEGGVSGP